MKTAIACFFGFFLALGACATGGSVAPFRELDSAPKEARETHRPLVLEHAVQGATVRDAVVRGDLEGAKQAARALVAVCTKTERPAPHTRVAAMLLAAERVEVAKDLSEAARASARLAERCGACHAAFGGPRSFAATAPPDALDVASRMRRHQWGAARLWEGLVATSDEAWTSGAAVLEDAPLALETSQTVSNTTTHLAIQVHALGSKASHTTTPEARAEVYGALVETCADCHRAGGGGPTGPRQ